MASESSSARQLSPNSAKASIKHAIAKRRPIFLWGPPGIGKSDVVHQIGEYMNAHVIDVRLSLWEPTDIKGIPYFDSNQSKMVWAPPAELPDAALSAKHENIILFLDEMNSAAPAVQAAAYQLILNRRVGQYHLPDNVFIVAAGNREADKGVTYRMPAPLANRFIHIEMRVDFADWFEWATANRVHKDVVGFLNFAKKDLYDFDPKSASRSFATPRSWSFVSELLQDNDVTDETLMDLISGTVGEGLAIKFMAHRKIASSLPGPTDVMLGKVNKMKSKEISAMYSLAVSLCYELKDFYDAEHPDINKMFDNFLKFAMDNFEPELVIMAVRMAFKQYNIDVDCDELTNLDEMTEKYGKLLARSM
jgi:hypothetical protein